MTETFSAKHYRCPWRKCWKGSDHLSLSMIPRSGTSAACLWQAHCNPHRRQFRYVLSATIFRCFILLLILQAKTFNAMVDKRRQVMSRNDKINTEFWDWCCLLIFTRDREPGQDLWRELKGISSSDTWNHIATVIMWFISMLSWAVSCDPIEIGIKESVISLCYWPDTPGTLLFRAL